MQAAGREAAGAAWAAAPPVLDPEAPPRGLLGEEARLELARITRQLRRLEAGSRDAEIAIHDAARLLEELLEQDQDALLRR